MNYFISFIVATAMWKIIEMICHLKEKAIVSFGKKYYITVFILLLITTFAISFYNYELLLNNVIGATYTATYIFLLSPIKKLNSDVYK
jgi:hypothetical protein